MDLFIANSHPDDSIDKIKSDVTYSEPLLLFHNTGKGLEDVSLQSGPIFTKNFSARGLAIGDFNKSVARMTAVGISPT